jgi:hypothetical protein
MPEVSARHGDSHASFLRAHGGEGLEWRVTAATRDPPPDPMGVAGTLVTDRLDSATADKP